ncbi:hypothetical protein Tco_0905048 [Tanacetum coccineum]
MFPFTLELIYSDLPVWPIPITKSSARISELPLQLKANLKCYLITEVHSKQYMHVEFIIILFIKGRNMAYIVSETKNVQFAKGNFFPVYYWMINTESKFDSRTSRSLATHFMLAMEEGRVMFIFDAIKEGTRGDELLVAANLAMQYLNLNGRYRPTLKEAATES